MQTLWTSEHLSIGEIVTAGDGGNLALPRFQRPFVWSAPAQLSFLAAVLRNLPSGALLLVDIDSDDVVFAPIAIDGAPSLSTTSPPERLILDGQQRITTLYRAFNASATKQAFVVDIKQMLVDGFFADEHLSIRRNGSGSITEQAEEGVVALHFLVDPPKMSGWYNTYVQHHLGGDHEKTAGLMSIVSKHLPGATSDSSNQLPVIKIKRDAPVAAVINVFEGINRGGTRLSGFDLMVARLYREVSPGSFFDLREQWHERKQSCEHLTRFGFDIDKHGLLPLQVIALAVSRLPDDLRPAGVRGVKQTDVLELPPAQVIGHDPGLMVLPKTDMAAAFRALDDAVGFLRGFCGVAERQLLPQPSMLIPLADQFLLPKKDRLTLDQMRRWFFASGLLMRYYGSVNSFVETDCRQLRLWASSDGLDIPDAIKNLNRDVVEGLTLDQPNKREHAILGKTIMCMIVAFGALDWGEGQMTVLAKNERVQIHHAVPKETLVKILGPRGVLDPIAGLTPITAARNGSLRDKSPADVFLQLGAHADPILKSHHFDPVVFSDFKPSKKRLSELLKDREQRLKDFIIGALGL